MTKKITPKQWHFLKNEYPEQTANMASIRMPADGWQLKSFWKNKKIKNSLVNHADPIGAMIQWCDDMLEHPFYVEREAHSVWITAVIFYFFDADDAVLFKLSWWNNE